MIDSRIAAHASRVIYDSLALIAAFGLYFFGRSRLDFATSWDMILPKILSGEFGAFLLVAILVSILSRVLTCNLLRSPDVLWKRLLIVLGCNALAVLLITADSFLGSVVNLRELRTGFFIFLISTILAFIPRVVRLFARREIANEVGLKKIISEKERMQRVLVIGGGGYIGSALVPRLLNAGMSVTVLDIFTFGKHALEKCKGHPELTIISGDFRDIVKLVTIIRGFDNVIHLGGLVGDPACAVDEKLTVDINVTASRVIAEIAKASGVKRFVFASSCSIYGASDKVVNETSPLNPQSLYAKSKVASELVISTLADENFSPIYARFGTIYGISGRTRFDLVVNLLSAKAVTDGKITVFGSDQWRPFVHVEDIADAVQMLLKAPRHLVHNQPFNVGGNSQNYTLLQVAESIKEVVPESEIVITDENVDRRNYRVDFGKIESVIGFRPSWTLDAGIRQMVGILRKENIRDFNNKNYSNVAFMKNVESDMLRQVTLSGWEQDLLDATEIDHTKSAPSSKAS
jgi:nucleoside-diphosphate-sugar epimerase